MESKPKINPEFTIAKSLASFVAIYEPPPAVSVPQPPVTPPTPSYSLPFVEKCASHEEIFSVQGENPVFLRPGDIERIYNIPASTVYDWIHEQPETHFPAVKLAVKNDSKRRLVLIPKRLFDEWIVEHSTLMREKTSKNGRFDANKDQEKPQSQG
jgi:hypothetical protein